MTYVLPFRRQKRPIPSQRSPKRTYFFKSLWTFQDPAPDTLILYHILRPRALEGRIIVAGANGGFQGNRATCRGERTLHARDAM